MNPVVKLGDAYSNPNKIGGNGRGAVYDTNGICATITTMSGGGNHPMIIVKVGDNIRNSRKDALMIKERWICENRTDEGLRLFKDECVGTIRTSHSGGTNE